jgi:hypothetical protein
MAGPSEKQIRQLFLPGQGRQSPGKLTALLYEELPLVGAQTLFASIQFIKNCSQQPRDTKPVCVCSKG